MDMFTILIVIALLVISLLVFYFLIQSATKSKQVVLNSDAQLKVLIEIALNAGVPASKIENEIQLYKSNKIKAATKKYNDGKITKAELLNLTETL